MSSLNMHNNSDFTFRKLIDESVEFSAWVEDMQAHLERGGLPPDTDQQTYDELIEWYRLGVDPSDAAEKLDRRS